ncbi:uncharacterized protein LOC119100110 [Pollicipes pollicipes]|uniref:uncharacterized protein LOC119100110 n=1 Tax=Pollicipes pollicipes TaxID=41117 RepID=UPI001884CB4D|nr:uncharacterized protein LOC119100110 [Pollicipes pollicipes]
MDRPVMSPLSPGARASSTENLIPPEESPQTRPRPVITTESPVPDDARAVPLLTLPPLSAEPAAGPEGGARSFPDIELHCRRTYLCPQALARRRCSCINIHRMGSRDSVCSVPGRSSEFAEIAADSLRINGAIRQFRHVSSECRASPTPRH